MGKEIFKRPQTGNEITRLSGFPTINHGFYFHVQSFTPDSQTLLFLSYTELRRDATPNIFRVNVDGTNLIQLTDSQGIESAVLAPNGKNVMYLVGGKLFCMDIFSGAEKTIGEIEGVETWINGPSRLHLSDTGSISSDEKSFVTGRRMLDGRFVILHFDLQTSVGSVLYEHNAGPSHVQFEPGTSERIAFCTSGDAKHRNIWTLKRDGSDARVLELTHGNGHFCWIKNNSNTKDFIVQSNVTSPSGAIKISGVNKGQEKIIAQGKNFWHASASKDGKWIVADTNWPDEGIYIISVETGEYKAVCSPNSSESHSQWTHPHPFFSPDGKAVVYTSDCSGFPQLYLAKITDEFYSQFKL